MGAPWLRCAAGLLAALGVCAAGGACTGPSADPGPGTRQPAAAPPEASEVALRVHQYRSDEVNEVLAVRVANGSAGPVTVESLEVVAPGFVGPGRVELGATVGPGRAYDLRVPLGDPDCGADPAGDLLVRVEYAGGAGPVDVVPTDGAAMMRRIHRDTCAIEEALATLPLRWGPRWTPAGEAVRGSLLVGPAGGDRPVVVSGIAATTLVDPFRHGLPRRVAPGASAVVDVALRPTRCDGHAFADNKLGFEVPVWVRLPGGAETVVTLVPPVRAQTRILAHLVAVCGL